jgi:NNP family nitrate/nitrite transporter-like MFS transporter
MLLFFVTGVGNASTFQMIPAIMRKEVPAADAELDAAQRTRQADKESAAIVGFTSAIAAYGAFFIPKSFGSLDRADRRAPRRALRLPRLLR